MASLYGTHTIGIYPSGPCHDLHAVMAFRPYGLLPPPVSNTSRLGGSF